jgi:hypothetical protein
VTRHGLNLAEGLVVAKCRPNGDMATGQGAAVLGLGSAALFTLLNREAPVSLHPDAGSRAIVCTQILAHKFARPVKPTLGVCRAQAELRRELGYREFFEIS